jgi:type IV pilus assembly protein PilB
MKAASIKIRIGDVLLEEGYLTTRQLKDALAEQKRTGKFLGEMLVEQGLVTAEKILSALSKRLGVRGCQLRSGMVDPTLMDLIGEEEAVRLKALPMFRVHDTLTVAMAEPQSLPSIDRLREITGCEIRPVLALENQITEFIRSCSGPATGMESILETLGDSDIEVMEGDDAGQIAMTDLDKAVDHSPVVNIVNMVLLRAVKDGASDIHIEPDKKATRIRYRIDGVLRDLMKPPVGMHAAIASRVKVTGRMDIAEKRLPQEGRVRINADGREIDLRVSSMPTVLGEKIVIRILDKARLKVRLEDLGFRPEALESFLRMLRQPYGLVLVTGPTGSGKTTTLYSALGLIRGPEYNIVTVEDPVEYQLDLINQIQVKEPIGMTFARALRSILRQDPDVIMVGEIRDEETARVAVQAALTGHLVLATLHTNDAPGAVSRLMDVGVEPYLLSGALNGVVAQRLVRTVCPSCSEPYHPEPDAIREAGLADPDHAFVRGTGCSNCHDSGFTGRMGIYEVMEMFPELRRMIQKGVSSHEIRDRWVEEGGTSLRQEAVMVAMSGRTSLEEALGVTHGEGNTLPGSVGRKLSGDPVAVEVG